MATSGAPDRNGRGAVPMGCPATGEARPPSSTARQQTCRTHAACTRSGDGRNPGTCAQRSTSELELLELGLKISLQPSRCDPYTLIVRCLEHGHAYAVLFQLR